jgi:hypothetical protein
MRPNQKQFDSEEIRNLKNTGLYILKTMCNYSEIILREVIIKLPLILYLPASWHAKK